MAFINDIENRTPLITAGDIEREVHGDCVADASTRLAVAAVPSFDTTGAVLQSELELCLKHRDTAAKSLGLADQFWRLSQ